MTAVTLTIAGLSKPIKDPNTLAVAQVHRITIYQVDLSTQRTTATLASFSEEAAKQSISFVNVTLPFAPPPGDAVQWLYGVLVGDNSEGNVLAGAKPIYAAAEDAA